ncbi:MAG: hypothetical protein R3C56_42425, partial [Pirellulaceae bacterium]
LVLKLHDLRRRVIVVGREASSSPVLKSVSDEFISIREFYSGHHVPNEVPSSCLDCIIWAHRLNQECDRRLEMLGIGYIGRGAETIGRLSEALLDLFPHFRPQAFGFPKNSGLRKLIQTLELDGICELEKGTAPGELLIHFRRDAISKVIKQPAAYEKILARRVKRGEKAFRKQWGETYGSDPPEMVRRLQSVTSDS